MFYNIVLYIYNVFCYGRKNDGFRFFGVYIGLVFYFFFLNDLCFRLFFYVFFFGRGKLVLGVGNRFGRESIKCNGMRDIMID